MESSILYFPYIHLPDNNWLYRSLLYWDTIGTIIPVEYKIPKHSLTHQLFDLKLAEPIHPEPFIYAYDVKTFTESFIELIDDEQYPVKPGALSRGDNTTRIHISKMIDIAEKLEERGLAKMTQWPWCKVESYTAGKFMAYLAGVVGGETKMTPATDSLEELSHFISISPEEQLLEKSLADERVKVLDSILPVPSRKPDLKRLAAFKERHRDELVNFRKHIENFLLELESTPTQALKARKMDRFKSDFEEEIGKLEKLIEENRLSRPKLGSILSLSSASFGTIAATLATGQGALFGAVAAALGLAGAAHSTYKSFKEAEEQIKHSFAAYALKYDF